MRAELRSKSLQLKWTPSEAEDVTPMSIKLLLETKLISLASEADEERLRASLMEEIPDIQIVGVYAAMGGQQSVYEALKSSMAQERGEELEERDLWHGTSWMFVPKILKQGFNRSFAGRHGTLLGHASYFSSDPRYSLRFCGRKGGSDGTLCFAFLDILDYDYEFVRQSVSYYTYYPQDINTFKYYTQ